MVVWQSGPPAAITGRILPGTDFTMQFIPDLPILLAYGVGVIILTFTPGPDMTFFLGRTLAQGVSGGFAAMAGASTGLLVHSMLVAFGLSALILASPAMFLILKIVGALYLLWLAVDAIRNGSALRMQGKTGAKPLRQVFLQGLGINLLNPKIIIFFLTFLPQFVQPSDPHASGKLLFLGVMFVVIALPFTVPMILGASYLTHWLKRNPRVTRVIDWLFASVFGAFAVTILLTQRN
jgi:threonine/homoserine/homoserine lactone efflux protein